MAAPDSSLRLPAPRPRGGRAPVPGLPPSLPAGLALRPAGRGPAPRRTREGPPPRPTALPGGLGACMPASARLLSRHPSRRDPGGEGAAGEPASSVLRPEHGRGESRRPGSLPTSGTCAALRLGSPYTLRPALLGRLGRRLGTSTNRPELKTRECAGQSPRAAPRRGGRRPGVGHGGRGAHAGSGGILHGTQDRGGPSGDRVRVSWRVAGTARG